MAVPKTDQKSPKPPSRGKRPKADKNLETAPGKPTLPGHAPRRAALDILSLVRGGASLDLALEKCRSFGALDGPDRAFARALASTVLRRQGSLDGLIGAYIEKPLPKRAERVLDILRLSAAQTAVMDVADHAAVGICVELVKEFRETEGYAGLVNAIARKIAKSGKDALAKLPPRSDTPGWLWRSWERAYGPALARAIAEAHRREPPLDLTLKPGVDAIDIAQSLGGVVLPTGSVRLDGSRNVARLAGFEAGHWWVQDAAAAIPARLLGDVAGHTVFDLCAAPGGKTMQLAAAGAHVYAVDSAGSRLKLVAENLQRTGLKAETIKAEILDWAAPGLADAVLLDAPCSATGTIRRNPDIPWSRKEDEVGALAKLQAKMIDRAVSLLKSGGLLVYATCSLQPEEGETVVAEALRRHPDLQRLTVNPAEFGLPEAARTKAGDLRTLPAFWPETGGMDGFFAARLQRK